MKTKVLQVMAVFLMISLGSFAQGINSESFFGFTGYTSYDSPNNREHGINPNHGNERKFNFAYVLSSGNGSNEMVSQGVTNNMTCTDVITAEQVELIFDTVKEFPEDTEVSVGFINNGQVLFYGLKRQHNTIINIDNHSYCGYTSAVAIDINNETGIVILSNVSGLNKKKGKFNTLCFNLLATFTIEKQ